MDVIHTGYCHGGPLDGQVVTYDRPNWRHDFPEGVYQRVTCGGVFGCVSFLVPEHADKTARRTPQYVQDVLHNATRRLA